MLAAVGHTQGSWDPAAIGRDQSRREVVGRRIMDYTTIQTFINSVGFPITCVVAMWLMLNKEREAHKDESDKMIEALNNNTLVLESIKTMLEVQKVERN